MNPWEIVSWIGAVCVAVIIVAFTVAAYANGYEAGHAARTPQITDEMVERAARAVWRGYVGDSLAGYDKHAYAYDREKAEYVARAALEAALGQEVDDDE